MGKKGAGKAVAKKARVVEEIYLYPKQDILPIVEGWILLELRLLLWNYGNIELLLRTDVTVDKLVRQIQLSLGRVETVKLYIADSSQVHNQIRNFDQTLGNLLQTFGSPVKETPEKYMIYYDFDPYNPKDPVLMAI